jgi:hypothetical protein
MSNASPTTGSLTALPRKKRPKVWRLLLICAPIICLAVYYAPLLVSVGWHVMHGMVIDYRGLRVRVPLGWTPALTPAQDDFPASPQGITLEKQPRTLGFESAGPEMMYFNLLLPDTRTTLSEQSTQWENLFRQSHPASDFDIARLSDLPPDMDCLQATPHASRTGAALACASSAGGWVAQYAGSESHVPVFLRIAAALKSKP